eukprot:11051579-Alexandrium_andersonii.AAC.1
MSARRPRRPRPSRRIGSASARSSTPTFCSATASADGSRPRTLRSPASSTCPSAAASTSSTGAIA